MSAQHTPGPWWADIFPAEGNCRFAALVSAPSMGDGGESICNFDLAHRVGMPEQEIAANARLIAAAPELLEALKAAVECGMVPISSAEEGGASKYSRQVIVADMIRAAIAKATGGGA